MSVLLLAAVLTALTPFGQRAIAHATEYTATGAETVRLSSGSASTTVLPPEGWRVAGPIGQKLWLRSLDDGLSIEITAGPANADTHVAIVGAFGEEVFVSRETLGSGLGIAHATAGSRLIAVVDSSPQLTIEAIPGAPSAGLENYSSDLAAFFAHIGGGPVDESDQGEPAWLGGAFTAAEPVESALPDGLPVSNQRIRNVAAGAQARFLYLPHDAFNAHVDEMVWAALDRATAATGDVYRPEASDGLGERGCVAGSTALTAEELLADDRFGPDGGEGLAMTCDLVLADGPLFGVNFHTVIGIPGEITEQNRETLYADTSSGEMVRPVELWHDEAYPDIWKELVATIKHNSGSLALAPIAPPSAEQLEELHQIFNTTNIEADGSITVRVPESFSAQETLGLERAEMTVTLPYAPENTMLSPVGRSLTASIAAAEGYTGPGLAPAGRSHIDCTLVPCVALTYDDGPSELTPSILDELAARRSAATFFMMGNMAGSHEATVARVAGEGHEVANHTWDHPTLSELPEEKVRSQVERTTAALENITGLPVELFRPPYGAYTDATLEAAKLSAVLWNVDTNDWKSPELEDLVAYAVSTPQPGDIVLMHDIHSSTAAAAPAIYDGLLDRGFTLVTVSQLHGGTVPPGSVVWSGPGPTRG